MTLRRLLLGLIAGGVACGSVQAKPPGLPINPLPEGRELDPVARDYHLGEPRPAAEGSAAGDRGGCDGSFLTALLGELLGHMTFPLGTAKQGPTAR